MSMEARKLTIAVLTLLLLCTAKADAAVLFIIPEYSPSHIELINKTNRYLGEDIDIETIGDIEDKLIEQYSAIVLVGPKVLQQWQGSTKPTVSVLTSSQLAQQHQNLLTTSIYLDPPLKRQLLLANEIVGQGRPVGVLFNNQQQLSEFQVDSTELKAWQENNITPYFSDQYNSTIHALSALLRDNRTLVGIYDHQLYSPDNIKTILISAYRQSRPLIGPSAAYLRAGALASTYSSIDDTALRLSEVLQQGLTTNLWSKPNFNPYFHVGFNEQVGRSLNLRLPNPDQLAEKIKSIEAAD